MAPNHLPHLSLGLLVVASACVLPDVSLDGRPCPCATGYSCNAATNTCVKGTGGGSSSTTSGTTTAVTSSTSATTTSGSASTTSSSQTTTSATTSTASSSSSTGTGGPLTPLPPLVIDSGTTSGTLSLSVAKLFRIQSTPASAWQWTKWFDLGSGSSDNLASTQPPFSGQDTVLLAEPVQVFDGTSYHDSSMSTVMNVAITDETPARVTVDAVLSYTMPNTQVHTRYTVYASGRMAMYVETKNVGATPRTLVGTESPYVSVNPNIAMPPPWTATQNGTHSAGFLRTDGPTPHSSLIVINMKGDTDLNTDATNTNWFWGDSPSTVQQPGDIFLDMAELQLGPGGQTAGSQASRANDVLNPGLTIVSGGTPVGSGYDTVRGAYTITANASATSVVFGTTSDIARYWPAFVIQGFTPAKWHVTLGGNEIVSSASLDGTGALASSSNNEIVIVLGSVIAQGAPDANRLLTLEAQ